MGDIIYGRPLMSCVEEAGEFVHNLNISGTHIFKTYETWGIVIFDSFSVAKCFQDRIGLQQLLLQFTLKIHKIKIFIPCIIIFHIHKKLPIYILFLALDNDQMILVSVGQNWGGKGIFVFILHFLKNASLSLSNFSQL